MMSSIADQIARTNRRKNGILCPNCAEPLHVNYTRSKRNGSIIRVRKCGTCGYRIKTEERAMPKAVPLMEAVR